ncbi:UDP-3-O-(3-hydroxymyristoyl)glucosamine N-acyltransferase [Desulfocapsa sulfexigens]|uniref:UDP-3-O-(3-hydroxymyristoyl)glucosamine N-acyltransferase n=1 Tax=Desulfocapsa sulfexigens TaxID=65555 RepID=UPI00034D449F|nr:UDP-3-O-(3-hydroxymyristoyl)glucosamine N-acyltransferase [Desulfocapsa sulfexigens]
MSKTCFSLEELATAVNGIVAGDGQLEITGFAPLETAGKGDISFLAKAGDVHRLKEFGGSAVIVPMSIEKAPVAVIRVDDPYLASAKIHGRLLEKPFVATGVHPQAWIGKETSLPEQISVAPFVSIGDRVTIGERVTLEAGVVLGDDVQIGDDTTIKANTTIAQGCKIGKRVTIFSGAVIGSDGYGYATDKQGFHTKRPQVGIVQIDDDVEIGANSCVDRAAYGVTHIKSGTKIDNLVQIAHNVVVGENSLIVSQVGIAGSVTLGRNVVLGGQAGVAGHITLGDTVMVAAQSGIHTNLDAGARVGGSPAIPMNIFARAAIQFGKLSEMGRDIRKLKKQMAKCEAVAEEQSGSAK